MFYKLCRVLQLQIGSHLLDILCHATKRCPVVGQCKQNLEPTPGCFCQNKIQTDKYSLIELACDRQHTKSRKECISIAENGQGQVNHSVALRFSYAATTSRVVDPLTWCRLQCIPLGSVVESPGSDDREACSLGIIQNFQHLLLQSGICSSCHEVIAIAAGEKKRRSIQLKASPVRGQLDKTSSWCWAFHSDSLPWQILNYTLSVATLALQRLPSCTSPVFFLHKVCKRI